MNRRFNPGPGRTHLYPVGRAWVAARHSAIGGLVYGSGPTPKAAWELLELRFKQAEARDAADHAAAAAVRAQREAPTAFVTGLSHGLLQSAPPEAPPIDATLPFELTKEAMYSSVYPRSANSHWRPEVEGSGNARAFGYVDQDLA